MVDVASSLRRFDQYTSPFPLAVLMQYQVQYQYFQETTEWLAIAYTAKYMSE